MLALLGRAVFTRYGSACKARNSARFSHSILLVASPRNHRQLTPRSALAGEFVFPVCPYPALLRTAAGSWRDPGPAGCNGMGPELDNLFPQQDGRQVSVSPGA